MITAYVTTYNEENRIASVLESLKHFDDIIVYDKSSTDRTREIAEAMGARIYMVPYYNETVPDDILQQFHKYILSTTKNKWIFGVVASDIVHCELYDEMVHAIQLKGEEFSIFNIPICRYSMGIEGKNTLFGGRNYEPRLIKKDIMPYKSPAIHNKPHTKANSCDLICKNSECAIYHLTHPTLKHVMDRHWRYAVQYVEDYEKKEGKSRARIMKYAWHEMLRVVWRYFKRGVYKQKETGLAQCMMLLMYNAMIYLNAFFSKEQEIEIEKNYQHIKNY